MDQRLKGKKEFPFLFFRNNIPHPFRVGLLIFNLFLLVSLAACSFDYGTAGDSDTNRPDIIMENLEYVRVRGGDPLVRLEAEYAERWEDRRTMELRSFSFEQMEDHGDSVNAEGRAGYAIVQLGSGDISLKGGVRIRVDSEDVTIRTSELEWKDKEKILSGAEGDEVDIQRSDGTVFSGKGFFANARDRTWSFSGEVKGQYVEKKDEDKDKKETKEASTESEADSKVELTEEEPAQFLEPAKPAAAVQEQIPEPKPTISVPRTEEK